MSGPTPIAEWKLERLALGELPAEPPATEDPELRARLDALSRSNEEILAKYPPAVMRAAIVRRKRALPAQWQRPTWKVLLAAPAMMVAIFALMVVLGPAYKASHREPPRRVEFDPPSGVALGPAPEEVREKGLRPHLAIYRVRSGAAERLADGARARPGDGLQVHYVAAGRRFGMILSIDGRGEVTLHLPEQPGPSASLKSSGEIELPHGYELDDAPAFERFIFVTSDRPLPAGEILQAARAAAQAGNAENAPLELPSGAEQTSFLVRKENR